MDLFCGAIVVGFGAFHIRNSSSDFRHFHRLSIYGVEKTNETGRLCRLVAVRKDLAVHGLEGEIKHGGGENGEVRNANVELN